MEEPEFITASLRMRSPNIRIMTDFHSNVDNLIEALVRVMPSLMERDQEIETELNLSWEDRDRTLESQRRHSVQLGVIPLMLFSIVFQ